MLRFLASCRDASVRRELRHARTARTEPPATVRQHDQTHAEHPGDVRETHKKHVLLLFTHTFIRAHQEDVKHKSHILDISSEA